MDPSAWEAIFFLLALKIPLVFVGYVVWRAIRAVPEPEPGDEQTTSVPVTDTPPDGPPWTSRRGPGTGGARHDRRRAGRSRPSTRTAKTR